MSLRLVWGVGPQINKFEKVSSDHHQMSLAGEEGRSPWVWCLGEMWVPYHVTYPMMHLMLTTPSQLWTDRCLWKHYLPATSIAGGNDTIQCFKRPLWYLQLHESVLHVVAQNCVNLTWLDVAEVAYTDDSVCFTIATNCKKLTGINLKAAPLVSMAS